LGAEFPWRDLLGCQQLIFEEQHLILMAMMQDCCQLWLFNKIQETKIKIKAIMMNSGSTDTYWGESLSTTIHTFHAVKMWEKQSFVELACQSWREHFRWTPQAGYKFLSVDDVHQDSAHKISQKMTPTIKHSLTIWCIFSSWWPCNAKTKTAFCVLDPTRRRPAECCKQTHFNSMQKILQSQTYIEVENIRYKDTKKVLWCHFVWWLLTTFGNRKDNELRWWWRD
jgi:hypothetical protein